MANREPMSNDDGAAEAMIGVVANTLRTDVPVRDEWRAGLFRALSAARVEATDVSRRIEGTRPSGWVLHPATAIAAGVACMLAGAALTVVFIGRAPHRQIASADGAAGRPAVTRSAERVTPHPAVRFVFVAPYASHVSLVGDFNRWNPLAMPMRRSVDGRTWTIDVPLTPGRHLYSFVVDGDIAADPAAPRAGDDDFGTPSSVIVVAERSA